MRNYKIESDFEYRGYRCVVVFQDMGHRCGYVGLKPGHPLYGKEYSDYVEVKKSDLEGEEIGKRSMISLLVASNDEDDRARIEIYFNVHGGITYAGGNSNYPIEGNLWWFGFDCAHWGDLIDLDKLEEYFGNEPQVKNRINIEKEVNSRYGTYGEIRTKEYVEDECKSLVDQIIKLVER